MARPPMESLPLFEYEYQKTAKESYDDLLRQINRSGPGNLGTRQTLKEGFDNMLLEVQREVNSGKMTGLDAEKYIEARTTATERVFIKYPEDFVEGATEWGNPTRREQAGRMMGEGLSELDKKAPGARKMYLISSAVNPRWRPSDISFDDLLKIGKSGLKKGAGAVLGGVAGLGAEILMPTDLGAADIEDPRYMSPDDPRRIRAERDVAGAEFLAEQPGFGGTAPWAGQEPRPRDPAAYETQDFNLPRDIADQLAPPVTEYPEEEQLMAAAEDLDATKEEAFASMAPIGAFTKDALNSLVDALNKALPLFGAPEDYATFAEDIEGALPTEFVRYLAMTSQAANDANLGRLAVDLENIGTDSDLMKAAGQLDVLAENDSFRTFMASADQETEAPVEEVVEEEVQVQTPISDTEVEAMFVERAR
jgi:hypothetical protein